MDLKDNIINYMNHEIRTPLNIIIGTAELASKRSDDTEYVIKSLKRIDSSSKLMLSLLEDVQNMRELGADGFKLKPIEFYLDEWLDRMIEGMKFQTNEKNQQLHVHRGDLQVNCICADIVRIEQLINNILINASKYTHCNGRIEFHIDQKRLSTNYVRTVFTVKDNGIGMSREFQNTMYDPFTRELKLMDVYGTGMGLAICKEIVDLMDGTIECKSSPGNGTEFKISLDLSIADQK